MAPSTSESDADLALRLRDGDEAALGLLYDRHAPRLMALAQSIAGRSSDAEEVVEEVFLQIWRKPEQFDPDRGSVATFLGMIARNRARDVIRSRRRRHSAVERSAAASQDRWAAAPVSDPGEDPEERVERREARERLDALLEGLTEEQRESIELAYFEGLTQSEIAEETGAPLGTVKTRIRDGMIKLRERAREWRIER